MDAAGNIGAASRAYGFTVDDTLPIPGESAQAGWFTGWHRIAVIAGAAAAGVIILALLLCACLRRRRRLHRLRSEGCAFPLLPLLAEAIVPFHKMECHVGCILQQSVVRI